MKTLTMLVVSAAVAGVILSGCSSKHAAPATAQSFTHPPAPPANMAQTVAEAQSNYWKTHKPVVDAGAATVQTPAAANAGAAATTGAATH